MLYGIHFCPVTSRLIATRAGSDLVILDVDKARPRGICKTLDFEYCDLRGVVTDSAGNIFVACGHVGTIRKLSPSGELLLEFPFRAQPDDYLMPSGGQQSINNCPEDVALSDTGNIYTCSAEDYFPHAVQEFSPQGKYLRTIHYPADDSACFARPYAIAYSRGELVVPDTYKFKIEVFGKDGAWKRSFSFPWKSNLAVRDFAIMPDGSLVIAGYDGGVWSVAQDGELLRELLSPAQCLHNTESITIIGNEAVVIVRTSGEQLMSGGPPVMEAYDWQGTRMWKLPMPD